MNYNKIRILALMIAISTLSGCNKYKNIDDYGIHYIEEVMEENDISFKDLGINRTDLEKFLKEFGPYISNHQFEKILLRAEKKYHDNYLYDLGIEMINNSVDEIELGFYDTFINTIFNDYNIPSKNVEWYYSQYIRTITYLVPKEDLYKAIFNGQTEELINLIMEHTGYNNRIDIENMIYQFSLIEKKSDYINNDAEYISYSLKDSGKSVIENTLGKLIKSKMEYDYTFANSLLGITLNDSIYLGGINEIKGSLSSDIVSITINDGTIRREILTPKKYLYEYHDFYELIKKSNEIMIDECYLKKDNKDNVMYLLSFITDWNTIEELLTEDESDLKIKKIYKDLSKYFSCEKEFHIFLNNLYNSKPDGINKYMNIFVDKITSGKNDIYNLCLYSEFINYYCTYLESNIVIEEIENMPLNELRNSGIYKNIYNKIFDSYNIFEYLEEINSYFKKVDLSFDIMCDHAFLDRDFRTGHEVLDVSNTVLSERVSIKQTSLDGIELYYCEIPDDYYDSECGYGYVSVLYEIKYCEIPYITKELSIDGEKKMVAILDINKSDLDKYPTVRFKKKLYNTNEFVDIILGNEKRLVYE